MTKTKKLMIIKAKLSRPNLVLGDLVQQLRDLVGGWVATHVHVKTDGRYAPVLRDIIWEPTMEPMLVYQDEKGQLWGRTTAKFDDPERFHPLLPGGPASPYLPAAPKPVNEFTAVTDGVLEDLFDEVKAWSIRDKLAVAMPAFYERLQEAVFTGEAQPPIALCNRVTDMLTDRHEYPWRLLAVAAYTLGHTTPQTCREAIRSVRVMLNQQIDHGEELGLYVEIKPGLALAYEWAAHEYTIEPVAAWKTRLLSGRPEMP